ncbi:hypothetical protein [Nocardia nova]|uniref:hypothetical protein n=1 Tax=Nocardia nova TaxID=37330 RepID=UPI00340076A5
MSDADADADADAGAGRRRWPPTLALAAGAGRRRWLPTLALAAGAGRRRWLPTLAAGAGAISTLVPAVTPEPMSMGGRCRCRPVGPADIRSFREYGRLRWRSIEGNRRPVCTVGDFLERTAARGL